MLKKIAEDLPLVWIPNHLGFIKPINPKMAVTNMPSRAMAIIAVCVDSMCSSGREIYERLSGREIDRHGRTSQKEMSGVIRVWKLVPLYKRVNEMARA